VTGAMKLITHPFDGDKKKLNEFIECGHGIWISGPQHEILRKYLRQR
jgi:hypothetical protein